MLTKTKTDGPWLVYVPGEQCVHDCSYHALESQAVEAARALLTEDPSLHVYVCEIQWTSVEEMVE